MLSQLLITRALAHHDPEVLGAESEDEILAFGIIRLRMSSTPTAQF